MSRELIRVSHPQDEVDRLSIALLALVVAAGAALRFWGLGNIGLHGDEDVMAMATRGILETGVPVIPSGMLYPRALPQLYLMALSVQAFGDSEWALRLPSAVIGTLMIVIAWFLARRFLSARWSVLFAAVIALLPSMIVLSQTARMYVFYVAFVMLFGVAIFRWERSGSVRDWLYAVAACIAALLFHTLTVFAVPLFFWPWLVKGSGRLFGLGAAAFVACGVLFELISEWSSAQYFPLVQAPPGAIGAPPESLQNPVGTPEIVLLAALALAAAGAAWLASRRSGSAERTWLAGGAALLSLSVALAAVIQYHLAALAWFFGSAFFLRSGRRALLPAGLAVLLVALFAWHGYAAWQSPEVRSLFDLAEALAGKPKPLSWLTFASFAPYAVAAYALLFLYFAIGFARGRALPDHVLLFLVAVLAPVLLVAFFEERYLPPRYLVGTFPFFVLSLCAGVRHAVADLAGRRRPLPAVAHALAALAVLALLIDPSELRDNVNPRYADFARLTDHRGVDHRGAAEYVRERGRNGEDIVIVMDSQQHGYYLPGYVDYYMRSLHAGRNSSILRDGRMLNLYTGIPQIATGAELERIVRESEYDEILVVGSGEIVHNRELYMSDGIRETMQELGFERAWLGRDGATPVWRYTRSTAAGPEPADAGRETASAGREPR